MPYTGAWTSKWNVTVSTTHKPLSPFRSCSSALHKNWSQICVGVRHHEALSGIPPLTLKPPSFLPPSVLTNFRPAGLCRICLSLNICHVMFVERSVVTHTTTTHPGVVGVEDVAWQWSAYVNGWLKGRGRKAHGRAHVWMCTGHVRKCANGHKLTL